ncbi:MAG: hypothetical protein IJQ24_12635, partial [Synergistaceae bacterium]|nr:hypothetical protein [Synergistaceae bacterium]
PTAASRLIGVRARFSEAIKEQTGEDVKDYLNATSHKTTESEKDEDDAGAIADVNDSKSIKDDGNDNDDNFENEIDDSNE